MNLRGVYYDWKDRVPEQNRDMGLIAQEVEQTFPEVVSEDQEGYKSINYGKLVSALIEAVRELNMTVNNLNEKVDKLSMEKK